MDHYVQLDEGHYEYEYGKIFRLFSDHPLRLRIDAEKPDRPITRFVDAVVGQNKIGRRDASYVDFMTRDEHFVSLVSIGTWYQYGFGGPQGPIANKTVNGYHVRQTSNFIVYRLGLDPHFSRTPDTIVIFSRKSNRLLVNEEEIAKRLTATFDMETVFVRMEDHTFKEQIAILRRTKVAIGMHGSIMISMPLEESTH